MSAALDPRAIENLVARIDADMPARRTRVVGFVSCSSGEGTSTLARAFAQANVQAMGRSVLLLHSAPTDHKRPSVIEALRDGQRLTQAWTKHKSGLTEAALGVGPTLDGRRATPWNLITRHELWTTLRDSFELVVVDMKSADVSDAALKVAPLCDGVVVVLEAARTRAPVVTQLLNNLNAVHARVLGTVLNKRRFHLPAALYRWL
jgi:Mrp family chromosome partitioning ATPase